VRTFQWPRSDVLAFLSLVATAIGTLVAVFAFPELHDIIFGSTAAPLAPRPPELSSPREGSRLPSETDVKGILTLCRGVVVDLDTAAESSTGDVLLQWRRKPASARTDRNLASALDERARSFADAEERDNYKTYTDCVISLVKQFQNHGIVQHQELPPPRSMGRFCVTNYARDMGQLYPVGSPCSNSVNPSDQYTSAPRVLGTVAQSPPRSMGRFCVTNYARDMGQPYPVGSTCSNTVNPSDQYTSGAPRVLGTVAQSP
jgi:hypothetical protein